MKLSVLRLSTFCAVVVMVLAGVGCNPAETPTQAAPKAQAAQLKSQSVSLACSKNLWCTLPVIAKDQGFFSAEGLDVSIDYVQAAKFAMDALVSSSSDFSAVVEVNAAYLGFTDNKNVSLIATIVESYDGAIVARKEAGIEKPSDLKGKRLGILQGTTSQFYAEKFLEKHGLSASDVEVQNLQPIAIQSAIVADGIDAGSLWEPFTHNISKALDGKVTVFNDKTVYTGYMNIAVRGDWADQNRAAVTGFIRALRNAQKFVTDNPEKAQEIMSREVALDLDIVKAIWGQYSFVLKLDAEQLLKTIADEAQWIQKTQEGFASKPLPDYTGYIDPNFLKTSGESK